MTATCTPSLAMVKKRDLDPSGSTMELQVNIACTQAQADAIIVHLMLNLNAEGVDYVPEFRYREVVG
jgi:hypothetical protein